VKRSGNQSSPDKTGAVDKPVVTGSGREPAEPVRRRIADDVADTARRNPDFAGSCFLCGHPTRPGAIFCVAHDWAAGGRR